MYMCSSENYTGSIRSSTNRCVGNNIGVTCTSVNQSKNEGVFIICPAHAQLLFNMNSHYIEMVSYDTQTSHKRGLVLTDRYSDFGLPFPYDFEYDANGELTTKPPCVVRPKMMQMLSNYVATLNIPQENCVAVRKITDLLTMIYTNNLSSSSGDIEISHAWSIYTQFLLSSEMMKYLEHRWKHANISILYRNNRNNQMATKLYPMANMPLIFKLILCNTEMGTNIQQNGLAVTRQYNFRLNADKNRFEVISNTDNPVFIKRRTNHSSANQIVSFLVLDGRDKLDTASLFNRHYNGIDYNMQPVPTCPYSDYV